jgi:ribonucleotide reductase alpha subunit
MKKYGRRNIALLTIAPTGTTSMMTQTTSGIEPAFLPVYNRNKKVNPNTPEDEFDFEDENGDKWQTYPVFHHKFETWLEANSYNPVEVKEIAKKALRGSKEEKKEFQEKLNEIVKKSPYYQATSNDVDWVKNVELQGAVQKYVDHSISVTVNLPEDISEEKVGEVYMKGWESGCKGVTVYRDGSRGKGVLNSGKDDEGGLEKITLVQNKVKLDKRIQMKPQAIKYKVKREQNKDSLHFIMTSDLYVDDKDKKAYFIPNEDFQIRAPQGGATSITFAQSGMDRSFLLKTENPDYAELIRSWQSPTSNEDEGIGPNRIKSMEHAAGLVFEDYLTRNGIIGRDEMTGELVNKVRKKDLRPVDFGSEEYEAIISQVSLGGDSEEEIEISGQNGKLDKKFVCERCGGTETYFEAGCHSPKCKNCGYDNGAGCE